MAVSEVENTPFWSRKTGWKVVKNLQGLSKIYRKLAEIGIETSQRGAEGTNT